MSLRLNHSSLGIITLFALTVFLISPVLQASAAGTLTNEIVLSSDNQVSIQSIHVIEFTTGTTGTIKSITITYPTGFNLSDEHLVQAVGIGKGTLSVAGQTLTYTVNSALSKPAGTQITIMVGGIVNAGTAGSKTVSVTTKDASNFAIDGPTTTAFTLTGVTSPMINNGAVSLADLAANSVDTTKIVDGTVVNADISTTAAIALTKLATGALPSGITVNSANIVDGSITGADISSGVALTGPVSIDSPTFFVDSVNHRVGIGHTNPADPFDVVTSSNVISNFVSSANYTRLFVTSIGSNPDVGIFLNGGGQNGWTVGAKEGSHGLRSSFDFVIQNQRLSGSPAMTIGGFSNNILISGDVQIGTGVSARSLFVTGDISTQLIHARDLHLGGSGSSIITLGTSSPQFDMTDTNGNCDVFKAVNGVFTLTTSSPGNC